MEHFKNDISQYTTNQNKINCKQMRNQTTTKGVIT